MSEASQLFKVFTNAEKHRMNELDSAIAELEQEFKVINKFIHTSEKGWALLGAKLRKERLVALTALAKSKLLLAEMDIFIAESELNNRNLENSRNDTKINTDKPHSPRSTSRGRSSSRNSSRRGSFSSTKSHSKSKCQSNKNTTSTSQSSRKREEGLTPKRNAATCSGRDSNSYSFVDKQEDLSCKPSTSSSQWTSVLSKSSPKDEIPDPNVLPGNSSRVSNISDINRSLTESIIAEFDKHSFTDQSLALNLSMSVTSTAKKRKINPVANVTAYKKIYTNSTLSSNSNISHTTAAANIKPSLQPEDPSVYSFSVSKEHSIIETPTRLHEPKINQGGQAPTLQKQNEVNLRCTQTLPPAVSNQVETRHIPILTPFNYLNRNHIENKPTQKYEDQTHKSVALATSQTVLRQEQGEHAQRQIDTDHIHQSYLQNPVHVSGQACIPFSSNLGPIYYENYTPDEKLNSCGTSEYVLSNDFSTKNNENHAPNSPTRVCFYNSM